MKKSKDYAVLLQKYQELLEKGVPMANGVGGGAHSSSSASAPNGVHATPSFPPAEFAELCQTFEAKFKENRKKNKDKNKDTVRADAVREYACSVNMPLHSTTVKGIRCMAFHPENDHQIVTGGADGTVIVFSTEHKKVVAQLKTRAHDQKPVTALAVHGDMIAAGCLDGQISVFHMNTAGDFSDGYTKIVDVKIHRKEISSLVFHPGGEHILSSSRDKSYAF